MEIREFLDGKGVSWLDDLDAQAAAKVTVALARIEQGNLSNAKGVGAGVQEYRIDWGPGYRGSVHGRGVILRTALGGLGWPSGLAV